MNTIEINVYGRANTGKSTVMEYIKRSLSEAGVESITMNCLDGIEVEELVASTFDKRLERLVENDTEVVLRYYPDASSDTSATAELHSAFSPDAIFVVVQSDDLDLVDSVIDILGASMSVFCPCGGVHEKSSAQIDSGITFVINEKQLNRHAAIS